MANTVKNRGWKSKILIACGVAVIVIIVTLAVILPISIFILNWIVVSSMGRDARKHYEKARLELISELDSFIDVNHRLPVVLSEIGLHQNALSYDIDDGCYYVSLITDDAAENSYQLKFGYRRGSEEYYVSKTGEWLDAYKMPVPFFDNDTLKKIDDIKLWLASDEAIRTVDSIRPNTSISFDYSVWDDDSIAFINQYDKRNGMAMKGWAVISGARFILFNEFDDWEYKDEEGKVYHKFWNYKKNDSLIYRPDPRPKFIIHNE